jgi:predicted nucleic acid-binding protein
LFGYRELRFAGVDEWRQRKGAGEPYGGRRLVVDTSAWAAIERSKALKNTPSEWTEAMRRGQLLLSPIVRLELLHHAKSLIEVESWGELFDNLKEVPVERSAYAAAFGAIRELAAKDNGYHRVGLADVLIAASAQEANVGVLHYNFGHFGRLASVLNLDSVELGKPGTFERPGEPMAWAPGYGPRRRT